MSESKTIRASNWRFWIILLVCIVIAGGAAYGARKAYKVWQPRRLAEKASAFLQSGDTKNAALTARRALQINNNDLASTRVMAELTHKIGAPETVLWRRRVSQLNPGSAADALRWVASAIQFHQYPVARQALAQVPEADRHTAEYHTSAGAVAIGLGQAKEAATHFAEAFRLDPANATHQYNHASARLMNGPREQRQDARNVLEKLTADPRYRARSRRALISDAASHNEFAEAIAAAREFANDPEAHFGDHLAHLELLRKAKSPDFEALLEDLKAKAAANAEDAGALISWMHQHGRSDAALQFALGLTDEMQASGYVGMAAAPCFEAAQDWAGLLALCTQKNWGSYEYLRFAYLSKASRELGDQDSALAQWNAASAGAAKNPESAKRLLQMIGTWKWENEVPGLLWATLKDAPDSPWALAKLYLYYKERGDTRGLQKVTGQMIALDPANEVLKNNHATYSLLLKNNVDRAFDSARENYGKNPANPIAVTTYALGLHRRGKPAEALQLMNTLTLEQLREPSTAAYYAVFLSANKAPKEARRYLEFAKSASLLPEEKELVDGVE